MTKITHEIGEFILKRKNSSAAQISTQISNTFGKEISRETIRRFINNPKRHDIPKMPIQKKVAISGSKKTTPKSISLDDVEKTIPTFSQFMNKMEKSDSWGAKLLKEKLNVKGKSKKVNQDRILRIIQYTLDILQE